MGAVIPSNSAYVFIIQFPELFRLANYRLYCSAEPSVAVESLRAPAAQLILWSRSVERKTNGWFIQDLHEISGRTDAFHKGFFACKVLAFGTKSVGIQEQVQTPS